MVSYYNERCWVNRLVEMSPCAGLFAKHPRCVAATNCGSESQGLFTVRPFLQGFRMTTNDQRQDKEGRASGEKH